MKVVAFLSPRSWDAVRQSFAPSEFVAARSWSDVECHLRKPGAKVLLFDPNAEGAVNLKAATTILKNHQEVPSIAYVHPHPTNLSVVLKLASCGLNDVVVRGSDQARDLPSTIRHQIGRQTALSILGAFAPALSQLDLRLLQVFEEIVQDPQKYGTPTDICGASQLSAKCIAKTLREAQLGTPRKLLSLTKVIWGYAYLRHTRLSVDAIGSKLGYNGRNLFACSTRAILGATPTGLRRQDDVREILMHAMEWLCKPHLSAVDEKRFYTMDETRHCF